MLPARKIIRVVHAQRLFAGSEKLWPQPPQAYACEQGEPAPECRRQWDDRKLLAGFTAPDESTAERIQFVNVFEPLSTVDRLARIAAGGAIRGTGFALIVLVIPQVILRILWIAFD